jgi:hypothetical protein
MSLLAKLAFILFSFCLLGCATKPLSAPIMTRPPEHSTEVLAGNIKDLDNALRGAASQTQRIKILIQAIPE